MRHCDKCDVDIADNINNCPLCGRDISPKQDKDVKQSFVCYPDNKIWVGKRNFAINLIFWILLVGTAISIFLEVLLFHRFNYNWYVVTGALLLILDVIMPLKYRWSFSFISLLVAISICAYMVFLEYFTGSVGWGLNYALPLFILFIALYSTMIMILRNYYKGYEFILCLLVFALLGIGIFVYNYVTKGVLWPSLVAFLTSVTCFFCFLIFKFKKVKQELKRNFFI